MDVGDRAAFLGISGRGFPPSEEGGGDYLAPWDIEMERYGIARGCLIAVN